MATIPTNVPTLDWEAFLSKYCARQSPAPPLLEQLQMQRDRWKPEGWMMLECQMLDGFHVGSLTILPVGPTNTYTDIPVHPISPRGLASDMSVVVAWLPAEKLPN